MTKKQAERILDKRMKKICLDSDDLLKAAKNYVEAYECGILPNAALDALCRAIEIAESKKRGKK